MLATSVRATNDARYRTEAANLANGMVADMWTMTAAKMATEFCAGCTKLTAWQSEAASLLPAPGVAVVLTPGLSLQSSTVVVTITWQPPGNSDTHNYVMTAQIGKNS